MVSSLVVLIGLRVAMRPADEDHPYGHGKAEPIAAALVATLLIVAAGWIAITALIAVGDRHEAPDRTLCWC